MAHFLLIHGASHGAWCWERLIPELAAHGHTARAIDLPGHGDDMTPRDRVGLEDYVRAVLDTLEPGTILVGHSFGGFPITLAAARAPERVRALVYLCALMPRPGLPFTAFRSDAISPELSAAVQIDRAAGVSHSIPEKAAPVFYSDCTEADRAWAIARLTPQPVAVMTEPVSFEPPETPRHYILCRNDRVVFPAYQRSVAETCDSVFELEAGHSPFLSQPAALAGVLDRIAACG